MKKTSYTLLVILFIVNLLYPQEPHSIAMKNLGEHSYFRINNGDTLIHVYLSSDSNSINYFSNNSGVVTRLSSNFARGTIPLNKYRALNSDSIGWITLSDKCYSQLDTSQKVINANLGRYRSGMDGTGVIVGVVDIGGIDSQNDDFKKMVGTNKENRILRIWDQTIE
ncbi:MAG: hypothetical protein P4L27_12130 [Ignavibacteriaceae bacterium]|nr:hypothetical protein [Ignavibacteriaceae bacterium]